MPLIYKTLTHPDQKLLEDIGSFRVSAYLRSKMSPPAKVIDENGRWIDKYDFWQDTIFWVVYDDSRLVATARLTFHDSFFTTPMADPGCQEEEGLPPKIAVPGRMIVDPDYQRRGIGSTLCEQRLSMALQLRCNSILVTAIGPSLANIWLEKGFELAKTLDDPDWNTGGKKFYMLKATRESLELRDARPSHSEKNTLLTVSN